MPMSVSVVIPVYNEEAFLGRCLESLSKQSVKPKEIIVVDNNSRDKSMEIAKKYAVKIITESKQGIIFARDAGFNSASGDYIARCDADSMLPPDWIERIEKDFRIPAVVAVTGPCYFYDTKLKTIPQKIHTEVFFKSHKRIIGYDTLFGSNMALRKSAWDEIKDEVCMDHSKVHEDMDLAGHLSKLGIIKFDVGLLAAISSRRGRSITSMAEYSARWIKSLLHMKKIAGED